jgi:hypothetical protein
MRVYEAYTGIGSRDIPYEIANIAESIAYKMAKLGYTLRSGAARGSDYHFEVGCDSANGQKEIFLPEKGFQGHSSEYYVENWPQYEHALELAEFYYGVGWKSITEWAKNAHTRNVAQVLGWTLENPSQFVFCYTSNGKKKGGTAQAMRVAEAFDVPIFNLYYPDVENFIKFLD